MFQNFQGDGLHFLTTRNSDEVSPRAYHTVASNEEAWSFGIESD